MIFYQLPQTSSYRHRFSGEADSLARKSRDFIEDNGARVKLKSALVPGEVYRRAVLVPLASNFDRHLAKLVAEGHLKKISQVM